MVGSESKTTDRGDLFPGELYAVEIYSISDRRQPSRSSQVTPGGRDQLWAPTNLAGRNVIVPPVAQWISSYIVVIGSPGSEMVTPATVLHTLLLLQKDGALIGVARSPVQVRNPDAEGMQTDNGAYMSSSLPVAGFAVIEANDIADAIRMVSGSPCAVRTGWSKFGRWTNPDDSRPNEGVA